MKTEYKQVSSPTAFPKKGKVSKAKGGDGVLKTTNKKFSWDKGDEFPKAK